MSTATEWLQAGLSTFELEMDRQQAIDTGTVFLRQMAEIIDDTAICDVGFCHICEGEPLTRDHYREFMIVSQVDYSDPDRWWL